MEDSSRKKAGKDENWSGRIPPNKVKDKVKKERGLGEGANGSDRWEQRRS